MDSRQSKYINPENPYFQLIAKECYSQLISILEKRLPVSFQLYNTAKQASLYDQTNPMQFYVYQDPLNDDSLIVANGTMKTKEEDEGTMLTFISPKSPKTLTKEIAAHIIQTFSRGPETYNGLSYAVDRNTSPIIIQALLNAGYIVSIQACDMVLHKNSVPEADNYSYTKNMILNNVDQSKFMVKSLEISDAPKVAGNWTYGLWVNPIDYVEHCIKSYPSYGIYLRENNELLSWVICYNFGSIGMLKTLEKCRGLGFGSIVMKLITLDLQNVGIYPGTGIEPRNKVSQKLLMGKLGFKMEHSMDFIFTS